ncbi:hypothetical protein WBG78_24740 [Chryseolinea sp. T2]|uniref:hypothetical protein n=1 Tax=Chryseolinea sp. T2 TaxID=3129255 RepID=UPI00307872AD
MRIHKILVIALLLVTSLNASAQSIWTIGPMLHVNFGGGQKKSVSFAIETAYWNVNKWPYSVDFGIEFDRKKTRFYSEFQTGIGVAGISAGPVFQVGKGSGAKLGLQVTSWVNYYLGFDYRMIFLRNEKRMGVGTYVKVPIATHGLESSSSGHSHWDSDWD